MKKALIIFAKTPIPGNVKTRLQPPLSQEEASRLYRGFVLDLIRATGSLKGVTRMLGCSPNHHNPFFLSIANRYNIELVDQRGKDLGERMENALKDRIHQGFSSVVMMGTDSPTLPIDFIRKAFDLLRAHEVVVGPSHDGGYYLVGFRKNIPPLFNSMPWGSDRVFSATLERINHLKLKCALLPFWYDVDTPADLKLLAAHLHYLRKQGVGHAVSETARILETLNGKLNGPGVV